MDPHLFGSFIEHMGRTVYTGIYEPGHPAADPAGRRLDVVDLVRELGVTCVRYPGGNYVSGHDWRDSVGPVDQRPHRLELAWRAIETHEFGLPEFMEWARLANVEPILAVNLGTAGIREAVALLEYCNFPGGTRESDLRHAHGQAEPYGVNLWCLGNEMDGSWQIGHQGAKEYGHLAAEVAKAMRQVDPTIRLASCGSSKSDMDSYPTWDLETLRYTYPYVDYLAVHQYYGGQELGTATFLAQAHDFDNHLSTLASVCDVVKAEQRSEKTLMLSIDEWGVWNFWNGTIPDTAEPWAVAPALSEQIYSLQDALLFGSMMLAMARHSDRVRLACQSLLTNISACIMTEPGGTVWVQPIFYPFAHLAAFSGAQVLRTPVCGPTYDTGAGFGMPVVDFLAVHHEQKRCVAVFAINRSADDQLLEVKLDGFGDLSIGSCTTMTAPDALSTNRDDHSMVRPLLLDATALSTEGLSVTLPGLSWTTVTLGYA